MKKKNKVPKLPEHPTLHELAKMLEVVPNRSNGGCDYNVVVLDEEVLSLELLDWWVAKHLSDMGALPDNIVFSSKSLGKLFSLTGMEYTERKYKGIDICLASWCIHDLGYSWGWLSERHDL